MCKILIVDDEECIREIAKEFVILLGFEPKITSNAIEALIAINKYLSIRMCILDLHLPGIDGLTLCRKINSIDPTMITIAMTGYKTLFSLVECRQAGFDDLILKPFDFETFKAIILDYDAKLQRWQNYKT